MTGMAPADDCMHAMFMIIQWQDRTLGVPLAQLQAVDADDETNMWDHRLIPVRTVQWKLTGGWICITAWHWVASFTNGARCWREMGTPPSIVGWCPFNETWGGVFTDVLKQVYQTTRQLDPTRPVIATSGSYHVGETDNYESYDYDQNPEPFAVRHAASAQGGQGVRRQC